MAISESQSIFKKDQHELYDGAIFDGGDKIFYKKKHEGLGFLLYEQILKQRLKDDKGRLESNTNINNYFLVDEWPQGFFDQLYMEFSDCGETDLFLNARCFEKSLEMVLKKS